MTLKQHLSGTLGKEEVHPNFHEVLNASATRLDDQAENYSCQIEVVDR